MLEILLVVALCKKIGATVARKGRRRGWYQFMLVAFWIMGEIAGAIVGAVVDSIASQHDPNGIGFMAYLLALAGAGVGAGIAFLIVHLLPDLSDTPKSPARSCSQCGEPFATLPAQCPMCGASTTPDVAIAAS